MRWNLDLDRWGQLNVMADEIAREEMTYRINENTEEINEEPFLPIDPCPIYIEKRGKKKRICSDLTNTLKREATSIKLRRYWIRKNKFSMRHEQLID